MVMFPDPPVGEGGPLLTYNASQLRPALSWAGGLGWRTKDGSNVLVPGRSTAAPSGAEGGHPNPGALKDPLSV